MNLRAGADSFLVHWEGNNDLSRTVQSIKALRKRVGIAINPATSATVLEEIMQDLDQVLVMTVIPGFGHQHFLHTTLPKIRRARQMIDRIKPGCGLEVDGGVDVTTAPLAVAAGADVLVAGSAMTAKESSPPWNGCGPQYASNGEGCLVQLAMEKSAV
jgi:ribulose-phosphate 3-epimerase